MQTKEILVIKNDDINYGIDTQYIDQIIRVPYLLNIPLSPREIRGLCAIGGDIIPAIDVNLVLGLNPTDMSTEDSRILLMIVNEMKIGILVSSITSTLSVDQTRLESVENRDDAVYAVYKTDSDIVQLLDVSDLIKDIKLKKFDAIDIKDGNRKVSDIRESSIHQERYLIFKMSNEKFAIHIDTLREIIVMPEKFSEIAGSSKEIIGLVSLRSELLVILDLRIYYGLEALKSDKNRVLVIYVGDKKIGLVVDEILDISEFDTNIISDMPSNFQDKKISGVIKTKKQLISMIDSTVIAPLVEENDKFLNKHTKDIILSNSDKDILEVVIFKLNGVEYAFNIDFVAEIMDCVSTTKVADTSSLIEGIINIRGQIVTIGSLYNRLSLVETITEQRKIIICNINSHPVGFFVDSVSGIEGIKQSVICDSSDEDDIFCNVLHLDGGKRLVLLIDMNKIFK
jgi:purine-binding chemotaxis protein CheW